MKFLQSLTTSFLLALAIFGGRLNTGIAAGPHSKETLSDWANLKTLKPGQEIRVVTKHLSEHQGSFESLGEDGISLRRKAREQMYAREDVLRVSLKLGRDNSARNVMLGAAIGAGAGLGAGLGADKVIWDHTNCTEGPAFFCSGPPFTHWGFVLAPVGGVAGAIVGAAISERGWRDIYRVR
jgi:hypothetical protein